MIPAPMFKSPAVVRASELNAHPMRTNSPSCSRRDLGGHGAALLLAVLAAEVLISSSAWAAPAQQAYIKASNTGAEDRFGSSMAVSGDTVVVGTYFEASSATGVNGDQSDNSVFGSGAAYVFVRNGTNWSQQAYLKASNTGAGDSFGWVAVSGDTVVVGPHMEDSNAAGVNGNQSDNSADRAGAAYVFVRNGATWGQEAYL